MIRILYYQQQLQDQQTAQHPHVSLWKCRGKISLYVAEENTNANVTEGKRSLIHPACTVIWLLQNRMFIACICVGYYLKRFVCPWRSVLGFQMMLVYYKGFGSEGYTVEREDWNICQVVISKERWVKDEMLLRSSIIQEVEKRKKDQLNDFFLVYRINYAI